MTTVHLGFKLSEDDVAIVMQALKAFRRGGCLQGVTVTRRVQHDPHLPLPVDVLNLLVQAAAASEDGADPTGAHEGEVNKVDTVDEA